MTDIEFREDMIDYITYRREAVRAFHAKFLNLMQIAKGSGSNHQAWEGGYLDHLGETMRLALTLYDRLSYTRELPFSLDSAMIVLYFHDIEKIWKYADGTLIDKVEWLTNILPEDYNIVFTLEELNALKYIHGEGDDYAKDERKMNALAAFCHSCDILSARMWHDRGRGLGLHCRKAFSGDRIESRTQ